MAEAEASRTMILQQIQFGSVGSGSGSVTVTGNETARSLNFDFLNREEEFGNLIMVGEYAGPSITLYAIDIAWQSVLYGLYSTKLS